MNTKLERIHKVISYAYFFFVVMGLLILVSALFKDGDGFGPGLVLILGFGSIGLIHWMAGKGAKAGTTWGRRMSSVIGTIMLFGFPLGTMLGIYILNRTGKEWQSGGTDSPSVL